MSRHAQAPPTVVHPRCRPAATLPPRLLPGHALLDWLSLTAELCAGRPVIAALHSPGCPRGHTVVVKGFATHGGRRVLVVDPKRLCPPERECEGELDEGFWLTYDESVSGWDGIVHWVDFYGIRRR